MIIRVISTYILIYALTNISTPRAETEPQCIPQCRSGYFCHQGQCISRCNPPCASGQVCSDQGECFTALDAPEERTAPETSRAVSTSIKDPGEGADQDTNQEREEDPEEDPEEEYTTIGLSTKIHYGISAGVALPNQVYIPEFQEDTDTSGGFVFRSFVDYTTVKHFTSGLYLNFISLLTPGQLERSKVELMSFGVTFKIVTRIDQETEIRAGVGLGVQVADLGNLGQRGDEFDQDRGYVQTDFAPLIEASFKLSEEMNALIGATIFSQLMRSTSRTSFEWRPTLFISGGIEFK